MPTLVVAGVLFCFPHVDPDPASALAAAWIGASFVGMTLSRRLTRPVVSVPLAGLVFAVLFVYFGKYLSGMGGTVGATALVAVFFVRGAHWVVGSTARRAIAPSQQQERA